MEKKQTLFLCLGIFCILMGSAIYVLFRTPSLLMFHWFDVFGLTRLIVSMRTWMNGFDKFLPLWFIYSLPFALYVSSYLFFIERIWWNSKSLDRHAWFWCIPVIAIGSEFAQIIRVIPGYFDVLDLFTIIIGVIFVIIVTKLNKINKGEMEL